MNVALSKTLLNQMFKINEKATRSVVLCNRNANLRIRKKIRRNAIIGSLLIWTLQSTSEPNPLAFPALRSEVPSWLSRFYAIKETNIDVMWLPAAQVPIWVCDGSRRDFGLLSVALLHLFLLLIFKSQKTPHNLITWSFFWLKTRWALLLDLKLILLCRLGLRALFSLVCHFRASRREIGFPNWRLSLVVGAGRSSGFGFGAFSPFPYLLGENVVKNEPSSKGLKVKQNS